jgi:hypothetical protein
MEQFRLFHASKQVLTYLAVITVFVSRRLRALLAQELQCEFKRRSPKKDLVSNGKPGKAKILWPHPPISIHWELTKPSEATCPVSRKALQKLASPLFHGI